MDGGGHPHESGWRAAGVAAAGGGGGACGMKATEDSTRPTVVVLVRPPQGTPRGPSFSRAAGGQLHHGDRWLEAGPLGAWP
jgi:hypothetical protein